MSVSRVIRASQVQMFVLLFGRRRKMKGTISMLVVSMIDKQETTGSILFPAYLMSMMDLIEPQPRLAVEAMEGATGINDSYPCFLAATDLLFGTTLTVQNSLKVSTGSPNRTFYGGIQVFEGSTCSDLECAGQT